MFPVEDGTPKKTLSAPEAGQRYFDLGRNASYEAARRGELPVIKIGSRLRVPIVALERMLDGAGTDKAETVPPVTPKVLVGGGYQHRSPRALRNDSGSVPVVVTTQRAAAQLRRSRAAS